MLNDIEDRKRAAIFPVGKYSPLFLFAGASKEVPAFIFWGDDFNMDTFEKRSHYFRELSLCLQRNGFTTQNNLEQMLSVEWEERPLAASIASISLRDRPGT